jgi:beta-glucosidase
LKIVKIIFFMLALFALLTFLPIGGKIRTDLWTSDFPDQKNYKFAEDFLWGAASAAQHIEHQQPSDWTKFEQDVISQGRTRTDPRPGYAVPGHINSLDKYSRLVRFKKTNYDEMFDSDFAIAQALGHNSHRFSISWARLFPTEGMEQPAKEGIAFYNEIFASLKEHSIQPVVSLFHFSTPDWFWEEKDGLRGWEREDAIHHFETFVGAVVEAFGEHVTIWTTLNEPMTYVFNGYMEGIFPPLEQRDIMGVAPVVAKLLEAHARAYAIVHEDARKRSKAVMVGIAKHTRAFEPLRNWAPLDRLSAAMIDQAFIWDFLDAIQSGVLKMVNTSLEVELPQLKGTQDYVGVNYYGRFYVESKLFDLANPKIHFYDPRLPDEVRSDLDWAIYPHGFFQVLAATHERYGKPIYVLENGLADEQDDDKRRQQFLVTHIREIWNAINHAGADVRGYMHWSFIDNFEWAEGFSARFGLIRTEYENEFKRAPRPSAYLYRDIINSNGISSEVWDNYYERHTD